MATSKRPGAASSLSFDAIAPAKKTAGIPDAQKRARTGYFSLFLVEKLRFPVVVFIASLGLFITVRHYAFLGTPQRIETPWDASWYRSVIETGYWTDGNTSAARNVVFLPLYPLACAAVRRLLSTSTPDAMLIVSAVSTLGTLIVFYNLLLPLYSSFVAKMTTLFFALGPFSLFLYNGYTEPFFLFLLALFFYALLREHYIVAGIIIGAASAVRPYAPMIVLVLIFEVFRRYYALYGSRLFFRSIYVRQLFLAIPLCFTGVAAYSLWLYYKFDDPLAFAHGFLAWSNGGSASPLLDGIGFHYLFTDIAQNAFSSGLAGPGVVSLLLFAAGAILILCLRRELFASATVFIVLMFLFLHFMVVQDHIEVVNLGRHFSLLLPFPLLLALSLEPRRTGRLLLGPAASNAPVNDIHCGCTYALTRAPALLLLLLFVVLDIQYTIMFYHGRFVS